MLLSDFKKNTLAGGQNHPQNTKPYLVTLRNSDDVIATLSGADCISQFPLFGLNVDGFSKVPFRLPKEEVDEAVFVPSRIYNCLLYGSLKTGHISVAYQGTGARPVNGRKGEPLVNALSEVFKEATVGEDAYRIRRLPKSEGEKLEAGLYTVDRLGPEQLVAYTEELKEMRDVLAKALATTTVEKLTLSAFPLITLDQLCRNIPALAAERKYRRQVLSLDANQSAKFEADNSGVKGPTI
jgi:hypothetical protein